MTTWQQQTPGNGYYPGQEDPNMRHPPVIMASPANFVYPPSSQGGYNPGYPPAFPGGNPSAPDFVIPINPPQDKVPPNFGTPYIPPPQQAPVYSTKSAEDETEDKFKRFDFSEKSVRRGFVRKVYAILMLQLLITVGLICLFLYNCPLNKWVSHNNVAMVISSFVATIVLIIAMSCWSTLRRRAPINYILLFLLTALFGMFVASTAALYDSEEVLIAAGITTVVCFTLTVLAFQSKLEFTMCNGIFIVSLIVLLQFGIVAAFMKFQTVNVAYASLGALICSVYLVCDTQMMMGGKHSYTISPEEYIFAALNLYIDMIHIFIYILRITGSSSD